MTMRNRQGLNAVVTNMQQCTSQHVLAHLFNNSMRQMS
jgi:hypothetical protein